MVNEIQGDAGGARDSIDVGLCRDNSLCQRLAIEVERLVAVRRGAPAHLIHATKIVQGPAVPLCGGPLKELESLAQIPAHALALKVKHAEIVLGLGELEIGSLAVPFRCLLRILSCTLACLVDQAERVHGRGITLGCGIREELQSGCRILLQPLGALRHQLGETILRLDLPLQRGLAVPLGGLGFVGLTRPAGFIREADCELRVDVAHLGQLQLLVEGKGFERLCRQLCGNEEKGEDKERAEVRHRDQLT